MRGFQVLVAANLKLGSLLNLEPAEIVDRLTRMRLAHQIYCSLCTAITMTRRDSGLNGADLERLVCV